jgi:Methyltransferase domain
MTVRNAALLKADLRLAELRMPGPDYVAWLDWLHRACRPATYLEIGVGAGRSLAQTGTQTLAIGVDPTPTITWQLQTEPRLFTESSNDFFSQRRLAGLLSGRPLDLVFIDGEHLFEQALADFMHVEAHCSARSVVLFHDTIPLNERTQSRIRLSEFHTGDVWKVVLCLEEYRPELRIFTIATPPAGLTVVTGFDPSSQVLREHYREAVAQFVGLEYREVESRLPAEINLVPNDGDVVASRLGASGIRVDLVPPPQ